MSKKICNGLKNKIGQPLPPNSVMQNKYIHVYLLKHLFSPPAVMLGNTWCSAQGTTLPVSTEAALLTSEVLKLTCLQVFEKYSYSWMYKFNLFAVFLLHSGYLHLLTLDDCNLIACAITILHAEWIASPKMLPMWVDFQYMISVILDTKCHKTTILPDKIAVIPRKWITLHFLWYT